jgi:hypothetical protein
VLDEVKYQIRRNADESVNGVVENLTFVQSGRNWEKVEQVFNKKLPKGND